MKRWMAVVAMAAMTSPAASEDLWPIPSYRYRVTGIESGDRLIVRGAPNGDTAVGSLDADDGGIVVTGRQLRRRPAADKTDTWWEIVFEGIEHGTGWVEARNLEIDPAHSYDHRDIDIPLACRGTEPSWRLAVRNGSATFTRPAIAAEGPAELNASRWLPAPGLRDHFAVRFSRADGSPVGWLTVVPSDGTCSDNLSELDYPYHATLVLSDDTVLGGCCQRAR